ncbi:MAG: UDP-N-acetylmuramoyl-L-alanine--D-glutamate ligase, partial [Gammaproteobacteria bacterium]|nr:UDP-N-acetylmuramoyl-L-alanine--D-glutamate ligase [Gammaproteobacteria bacterium]
VMLHAAGRKVLTGGNIGVPALDLLRQSPPDFYVLELSSFQLERTRSLNCRVAALINISRDHIDHHGSMEAYVAAKAAIFSDCGVAVYNRQDPLIADMIRPTQAAISFGLDSPAAGQYGVITRRGTAWLARGARLLVPTNTLKLPGPHNVANVLAALAVGEALGLGRESMVAAAQSFRGLPHRNQWVSDAGGLNWINDSKGTNVGATVAAIAAVRGRVVLIAGGDGKGADFAPLAEALGAHARGAVLLGKDAQLIAQALEGTCETRLVDSMPAAVEVAQTLAQPGDTVLLSPACSSLDMYANYEARGEAFINAIRRNVA